MEHGGATGANEGVTVTGAAETGPFTGAPVDGGATGSGVGAVGVGKKIGDGDPSGAVVVDGTAGATDPPIGAAETGEPEDEGTGGLGAVGVGTRSGDDDPTGAPDVGELGANVAAPRLGEATGAGETGPATGRPEDEGTPCEVGAVGVGPRIGDVEATGVLVVDDGTGARLSVGAGIGDVELAGDDVTAAEGAHLQASAIRLASVTQVAAGMAPSNPACSISRHATGD
jgi:hypothetical protein